MKINHKILSIPPYISTSWKNIASLHCEYKDLVLVLVVSLNNATRIEIPDLEAPIIEAIFNAHSKFLEQDPANVQHKNPSNTRPSQSLSGSPVPNINESLLGGLALPLQIGPGGIENLGAMLQHNSDQAHSPDLPKEILNKIASISKAIGIDDPAMLPKPEPHCNCFHCQISRAIQSDGIEEKVTVEPEEEVTAEDLKFRVWDISQTANKLYLVSNASDSKEHYSVFLGEPIGCTCGEKNCEHVRAVLNS